MTIPFRYCPKPAPTRLLDAGVRASSKSTGNPLADRRLLEMIPSPSSLPTLLRQSLSAVDQSLMPVDPYLLLMTALLQFLKFHPQMSLVLEALQSLEEAEQQQA